MLSACAEVRRRWTVEDGSRIAGVHLWGSQSWPAIVAAAAFQAATRTNAGRQARLPAPLRIG